MLGIFKAKSLARILLLILCPCLLCDAPSEFKKAQDLLANGSLSQAVVVLRQVVRDDPGNSDAHLLLGNALALQGLRAQSLKEIETAINLSPDSAKARNQLGVVLSRFLETDAARKAFEDALSLDPDFAEAHVNLALLLAQTGELSLAHEHLDRALVLYGATQSAARAYFLRAKVWSAQGDNDNAILDLEKATQVSPGDADAWFDLSQLKSSKGDPVGAIAAALKTVDLEPQNAQMQSWLGRLYLENGDAALAVKHLQTARSLGLDDKATLYSLTRALRAIGKIDDSKQVEEQVLKMQRLSTQAGEVLFTASALNEEGLKLEHNGDLLGALDKYHAAVDLDPTGYGFRLNYGLALCRIGKWEDGIAQLQEVLKEDPDNANAAKALFIAQEEVTKMSR
ncbi:MAG: tetratricopeptide repeat protein [Terracidiphilus sp.]